MHNQLVRIFFVFSIIFCGIFTGVAQDTGNSTPQNKRKITVEKPDLDDIKAKTLDPSSPFYFPKLMAKYNRNDTVMTNEEYRYFYLG